MTATIEIERVIRIIEKTEDEEVLREIYEWLQENDLMRLIPRKLWRKLIDSLESESLTPEDERDIEEALRDEFISHEEIEKEFKQ